MGIYRDDIHAAPQRRKGERNYENPGAPPPPPRHKARGVGLEGRLIACFVLLASLGLGGAGWLFATQGREQVSSMMGESARQAAFSLALASQKSVEGKKLGDLRRICNDLLKTRNTLFVGFLDPDFRPLAMANRYADFSWKDILNKSDKEAGDLMLVRNHSSRAFGDYMKVIAPVLNQPLTAGPGTQPQAKQPPAKVLGYVVVGMGHETELAWLQRTNAMVMGIGAVVVLLTIPVTYFVVRQIFAPIRQLVSATEQIAAGRLDIRVPSERPDAIGVLARSFGDMAVKVKQQQDALANANHRLADTNGQLAEANAQLADANNQLGEANKKLAESNEDLERKVSQRTAQLEEANGRLNSSNDRLTAEIAEKEAFMRAVSHDLNAPLRNISGMASMLLMKHREKFDDDIIHRLERIQKNVQVETDLIGELLELSRIKTRRQKKEMVDLDALARDVAGLFEADFKTRNIAIHIDNQLPVLYCERGRLQQVFQNLIDNAIKYMGDGPTREIHLGCTVRPREAEFHVRDTGIGIHPDDVGKVFHVFRRGKNVANKNIAGKGVGLSSVKSIIETYDGAIRVESELGKGSTFRFTIDGKHVPACPAFAGTAAADAAKVDEPEEAHA